MSSSNSLIKAGGVLVADASVAINIVATGFAARIVAALPCSIVVTSNAVEEISAGTGKGRSDFSDLQVLISKGLMKVAHLRDSGSAIYRTLVEGSALATLDDGEAATIGHAVDIEGVALIDERKARNLCAKSFPRLAVVSTAELFLHASVADALGPTDHVKAIISALQLARMRVPSDFLEPVIELIGEEQAATCMSLPAAARTKASTGLDISFPQRGRSAYVRKGLKGGS